MREGSSLSATREALQILIPSPFDDELFDDQLVVKEDDCPSWRGAFVEFHIVLSEEYCSETADSLMKQSKTNPNHDLTRIIYNVMYIGAGTDDHYDTAVEAVIK